MPELEVLTLRDPSGAAVATLLPERGGLVTSFDCGPRKVLYMDPETLLDPTKSVRGGIPILFPSPGKLQGDSWSRAGRSGSLKQHGVARNLPWLVTDAEPSTATLRLVANPDTFAQYPWDFALDHTISIGPRSLRLEQRITNRSDTPMPFGLGFHPYFHVPSAQKAQTTIPTAAKKAFDNVSKREVALSTIDLTQAEVDLHLLEHGGSSAELKSPAGSVHIKGSPEYQRWVVWTLAGKDFVCLEPWTSAGNALNTGEGLLEVAPASSVKLFLEIGI